MVQNSKKSDATVLVLALLLPCPLTAPPLPIYTCSRRRACAVLPEHTLVRQHKHATRITHCPEEVLLCRAHARSLTLPVPRAPYVDAYTCGGMNIASSSSGSEDASSVAIPPPARAAFAVRASDGDGWEEGVAVAVGRAA